MLNIRQVEIRSKRRNLFDFRLNRFSVPTILIGAIFIFYIIYSFNLQIIKSNQYLIKAANLNISEKTIEPQRGIIYDVNSIPLVKNVEKFDLYLRKRNYSTTDLKSFSFTFIKYLGLKQDEINADFLKIQNDI